MRFGFRRRPNQRVKATSAAAVLAPYGRPTFAQRHRRLMLLMLGFIAMLYGAFFAVTTTFFLVQMLMPLAPIVLIIIWALPDRELPDSELTSRLLLAFIVALLIWPNYLALAIPGMPWITAQRLLIIPLVFLFLLRLSQSSHERRELVQVLGAVPIIWKLVAVYAALVVISVAFSATPFATLSKAITALFYWVMVFFIAVQVFARPGAATKFSFALWFCVAVVCLIVVPEMHFSRPPWATHIPSFLAIQDDTVSRILGGATRSATGAYRAQSTFSQPLGFAEFLGYAVPFLIHILFTDPRLKVKVGVAATLPLVVYAVVSTDSRVGFAALFMSVLLYALFYGAYRWRRDSKSLLGPATVLAFPVGAIAAFAATFVVGRLRAKIWEMARKPAAMQRESPSSTKAFPRFYRTRGAMGFRGERKRSVMWLPMGC